MVGTDVAAVATIEIEKNLELESMSTIEIELPSISTRNVTESSICVCEFCGQAFNSEDQVTSQEQLINETDEFQSLT